MHIVISLSLGRSNFEGMYEANSNLQNGNTQGIHRHLLKFRESAPTVSMNVHQNSGGQLTPLPLNASATTNKYSFTLTS
ncbi:hypothetical protein DVH24_008912 [Malus domestica]|uniref:Uncharacterized protein n=1 Tax=Malus domestica TaxID=3750 RepID=A0A498JL02_MALDO|nr:hypothetical protein DVH24_008912 [Malus domestica]